MDGKTLGEALENKTLSAPIIEFLSGAKSNMSGNYFSPANEAQEMLKKAATILHPLVKKNGNGSKK
jgi:hypothetical protein